MTGISYYARDDIDGISYMISRAGIADTGEPYDRSPGGVGSLATG